MLSAILVVGGFGDAPMPRCLLSLSPLFASLRNRAALYSRNASPDPAAETLTTISTLPTHMLNTTCARRGARAKASKQAPASKSRKQLRNQLCGSQAHHAGSRAAGRGARMGSLPPSGFGVWRTAVNSFSGSAENNPSYIMDLVCDASELHAAVAGSEFDLKLYERETLSCCAMLAAAAHSDRINELSYAPTGSAVAGTLFSASSDGHVRGWDASVPPRAGCSLDFGGRDEVWSVSASDGPLVATGTQSAIVLWDVRKSGSPAARLEVHTEPVTAVSFQPGSATSLVSGSVDELICSIDCRWRGPSPGPAARATPAWVRGTPHTRHTRPAPAPPFEGGRFSPLLPRMSHFLHLPMTPCRNKPQRL